MTAPAGLYNISAKQGSTFSRSIVWVDPRKKPIRLRGYTARMQVRPIENSSTVIIELTTENGRISLGESNGTITLSISSSVTQTLLEGKYVYDLELVAPGSGKVYKLVRGNFVVIPEVTY
jgi:hypothetical protein